METRGLFFANPPQVPFNKALPMLNTALLINLLGFSVGIALYSLLLAMVFSHRRTGDRPSFDRLLALTGVLGLTWNLGEFIVFVLKDFGFAPASPWLLALPYSALGFLPSVVVHSTWKSAESAREPLRYLTVAAYFLSAFAAALNLLAAAGNDAVPSRLSLRVLSFGALAILAGLLVTAFRQSLERKAVWVAALLVFALSALHLSAHSDQSSWPVELVAHQSSLPLAVAILLQDYRFAFADLFLKRALSLMMLALVAFGFYVWIAVPLLAWHESHDRNDVQAAVVVLALWIGTALIYPKLHRAAEWFVDSVLLRRTNFEQLKADISADLEREDHPRGAMDVVTEWLRDALGCTDAKWRETPESDHLLPAVEASRSGATVAIPTVEPPRFNIELSGFAGGRNLLSGEIQTLESVALIAARRIDALRVTHERCEVELREQEFSKLAAEAQLSALRAQINPHFLFNSLTTIGYLIRTAPDRAFETLMHLTKLLRGVLAATGEFSTLSEEVRLIENYLDIESARFEERLRVRIDVADELGTVRIPSLVLQPLVENAIKHAVSRNKSGGEVCLTATVESDGHGPVLVMAVTDTGAGKTRPTFERADGVGLRNIRERLESYYGGGASLTIGQMGAGTRAELRLPVSERAAKNL